MKKIKIIGIVIAAVVIFFAALVAGYVLYMGTPTAGNRIAAYENPNRALLVIDIQEDLTGPATKMGMYPEKDIVPVIANVNALVGKAVEKKFIIVYIRQEFDGVMGIASRVFAGGALLKGTPGSQVDKRVSIRSDYNVSKPRGDSFSNPELDALLVKNRVSELYLTGLDAEHCVHNTAKGALNRGYRVNIITDAILLSAKKKWNNLLEEYKEEGIFLMKSKDL
jgi:nicotinamidase/pyrazinamidase